MHADKRTKTIQYALRKTCEMKTVFVSTDYDKRPTSLTTPVSIIRWNVIVCEGNVHRKHTFETNRWSISTEHTESKIVAPLYLLLAYRQHSIRFKKYHIYYCVQK
jgi:hypothetical protein